ncbi:hypothetical protein ES708_35023 [subsurface metagenome]
MDWELVSDNKNNKQLNPGYQGWGFLFNNDNPDRTNHAFYIVLITNILITFKTKLDTKLDTVTKVIL